MNELRQKARSLMMFAGMVRCCSSDLGERKLTLDSPQLRYRLTSETYSSLTRLDVFIH